MLNLLPPLFIILFVLLFVSLARLFWRREPDPDKAPVHYYRVHQPEKGRVDMTCEDCSYHELQFWDGDKCLGGYIANSGKYARHEERK